jgi:hypothetical protein
MKAASVVNMSPVDDPAIRQPGFDLQRPQWSLLDFARGRDLVKLTSSAGAWPEMTAASVAQFKPWTI